MELDFEKCAMLIMKSGEKESVGEVGVSNQECIGTFGEKKNYKYFGILKTDTIKETEMKKKEEEKSISEERENFSKPSL